MTVTMLGSEVFIINDTADGDLVKTAWFPATVENIDLTLSRERRIPWLA
jgi:hypothetical protein